MSSIGQSILMALTVTVNKFASSNVQAVQRKQRKGPKKTTSTGTTTDFGRRGLLLSAAVATPQLSDSGTELLKSITFGLFVFLFRLNFVVLSLLVYGLPPISFLLLFSGILWLTVVIELCIRVSEEVRRQQGQE